MKPATSLQIKGPAGSIELAINSPENEAKGIAIICHPHPQYGGTMNNKVVTTLARTFVGMDLVAIRFNFRGVGKSEGNYDQGIGEAEDLNTVLDWATPQYPNLPFFLAGFSFGAWIALKIAIQRPPAKLITVAPPVTRFEFSKLPEPNCPWLIIHGDQDELFPIQEVQEWYNALKTKPNLVIINNASHFFHGKLIELKQAIECAAPSLRA